MTRSLPMALLALPLLATGALPRLRGGAVWTHTTVARLLARVGAAG